MADARDSSADFVTRAVQVYRDISKAPSITRAKASCLNQGSSEAKEVKITSYWSQRDLETNETRKFQRRHAVTHEGASQTFQIVREDSFPVEVQNQQLISVSSSERYQAILRKVPGSKGDEEGKQVIEIWSTSQLIKTIDMKAYEKHGKIYEDSQFGTLAWSSSEKYLLYVAEKKLPKAASYFERENKDASLEKPAPVKGNKFEFKDNWGEQLSSKCTPVLVTLDITSEEIKVLDGVPEFLSAGQAVWGPGDNSVVFIGWFHEPYRLGIVYCPIRKSALFSISLDGSTLEQLSDIKYAVHSPHFNSRMDKMIYIAVDVGGAHMKCGRLMQYDWTTRTTTTVIDVVDIPEKNGFPGIYNVQIPVSHRCWTSDGKCVILDTYWRSSKKIILVNCDDKSVTNLTQETGYWSLLDVVDDIILASYSSPNSSPKLMIAALTSEIPKTGLNWVPVAQYEDYDFARDMTWEVVPLLPRGVTDFKEEYEVVFLEPKSSKEDKKPPLIVFPHGGPHVCFASEFFLYSACLCKLGFSILNVNFRGSLGFGQTPLHSLPGNVGAQDVEDVQLAASTLVKSGKVDGSNVFMMGGSHGGFLTAHLIGQYPDFYRAVAMRNTVVNVAVMTGITDMPDWCYFENGGEFQHDITPSPELFAEMLKRSPITHASKVKTPTLILLGEEDRRVPPSQGISFYKVLKAQGNEVRMLSYPGNDHPINKVEAESDVFVNMARWFYEHLNQN